MATNTAGVMITYGAGCVVGVAMIVGITLVVVEMLQVCYSIASRGHKYSSGHHHIARWLGCGSSRDCWYNIGGSGDVASVLQYSKSWPLIQQGSSLHRVLVGL